MKSDFRTMPSLTSFRSSPQTLYCETSLNHTYPYNNDKVHPSSRSSDVAYTCLTQVPTNRNYGPNRHVTFSSNQNRGPNSQKEEFTYDQSRRSPFPPGYENLVPEMGGLYTSLPRSLDDEDGNTTTSGSYTIESDNLNDSIISAWWLVWGANCTCIFIILSL